MPVERFRSRLILGAALMGVGFLAELVMLSGLVIEQRPPAWFWGLLLWIGVGSVVVVSAFVSAARDRRERTLRALSTPGADGDAD